MMKKLKNGVACLLTAMFLTTSLYSCAKEDSSTLTPEQVSVWTVSATEKVLQDKPKSDYTDKAGEEISLVMAKNEYESGQIIISPEANVSEYGVSVSNLVSEDGNAKILAENVDIYVEKYLDVNYIFEGNGAPTGKYPDALVPIGAITEYGENSVKKDNNQGIYLTVKTAKDQTPGVYRGNVTVDFKDFTKTMPFTVTVKDVTVSDENHRRDVYVASQNYESGELNSTQAMRDTYAQALIDYRLATTSHMTETLYTASDIQRWVEKCYYYLTETTCSTIGVPYRPTNLSLVYDDDQPAATFECFEPEAFKRYVAALADYSVEKNFDMLEHAVFYNAIIDEAIDRGVVNQAKANIRLYAKTVPEAAEAFALKYDLAAEYGKKIENPETLEEKIYNGILTIENTFTAYYYASFSEYDDYITYVPLANGMDSASQREEYEHQKNKWWYYCNNPRYPYVSIHVDNTNIFTTRMMGWMQADYDIKGTLYWGVNMYTEMDLNGNSVNLEDYFEGKAQRTKHFATGEGYLFYPGRQYGLDTPIPSMRIMALRDGYEEYELIYALKERYKENGFSADELVSSLTSQLYTGTNVSAETEDFLQARQSLLDLCEVFSSSAQMSIIGSKDNGDGNMIYKVFSKSALTVNGNGVTGEDHGDGKIYTITKKLSEDRNVLKISFAADGKNYTYTQNLGGKVSVYNAEELASKLKLTKSGASVIDYGKATLNGEEYFKADIAETKLSYQDFLMTSDIFSAVNEATNRIVFTIYYDGEEDLPFTVYAKYKKKRADEPEYFALINTTLKKGENVIELSVAYTNWKSKGGIECLRPRLGADKENPARTLYFKKIAVYAK